MELTVRAVIVRLPSKAGSPTATSTTLPTRRSCTPDSVSIATLLVIDPPLGVAVGNAADREPTAARRAKFGWAVTEYEVGVTAVITRAPSSSGSPSACTTVSPTSKKCRSEVFTVSTLPVIE